MMKLLVTLSTTLVLSTLVQAQSVITDPSERLIKLPIKIDENGKIIWDIPKGPGKGPDRLIAACRLDDLKVQVIKNGGVRRAVIEELKEGQESERKIPYVLVQKLTKEMLGQYAAAVAIAQALGITEVDYVKIFVVDPQTNLNNSKLLVFFYDPDDDLIERTLVVGQQWVRCSDSL